MKILLEAPILTRSGYGEHARLVFKALSGLRNVEVLVSPLSWGQTSWISNYDSLRTEIERSISAYRAYEDDHNKRSLKPFYDIQIHVGILNELEKKSNVTYSVTAGIESDRVSAEWIVKTHQGVDKIIVPSNHSKTGFINTICEIVNQKEGTTTKIGCASPIEVVPYPVKNISPKDLDFSLDTKFNFLTVALMGPRKNIENTIKWFVKEFKDEDVGLVIKTGRARGSLIDKEFTLSYLKTLVSGQSPRKCKVYLLHGDLTEAEMASLYTRRDIHAYVTATHGEGYGLPIFEAAYAGLPVIATNWSGHLDFLIDSDMNSGNKKSFAKVEYELKEVSKDSVWKGIITKESRWAYPKELSFRKQMRSVYGNHGMYKKWSKHLKERLISSHSEENVIKKMRKAIFGHQAPDLVLSEEEKNWNIKLSKIERL